MVKGKPKADGGAGKKGSKVDAAAADEDMHRMEMCVGWIYEFFSRHRLEEAQDALVKSAEKRFHISLSSLQAHSDPCSILQQLLDKGEFEQAFAEFDDQLEDFKSVVGEDLYADTLLQVMIQTTLQNLRAEGGKNNFEDFRQRVKDLFPERKKLGSIPAKTVAEVRTGLLAATKKDIGALLEKYSLVSFKEHTANFWRELRRAQPATKLEKVMQDIDDGKIKWDETDAEEHEDEVPLISASRDDAGPSAVSSRDAARAAVPAASSSAPAVTAEPKVTSPAKAAAQSRKKGLALTAWELRESLPKNNDDGEEEEGFSEWLTIHAMTHPNVKAFLDQSNKRQKEEQGKGKRAERQQQQVLPAKRESARATHAKAGASSDCDAAEADDEYDLDAGADDKDEVVTSTPKRRKVEPVKGAGGKARGRRGADAAGGSASAHTQNLADTEEDEEEAARHQGLESADANSLNPKDKALLDQHQEHKKKLDGLGDDPLEAARATARSAKGRRFQYNTDDKGRQVAFSDDHDDDDDRISVLDAQEKYVLNPVDTSFKPRRDILADATSSSNVGGRSRGGVAGSKSTGGRWTQQEEDALRAGVKAHGEGRWKIIQENFAILKDRTTVNLKDKWRNLTK